VAEGSKFQRKATRWGPVAIAGVVLAIGTILGLWPRGRETTSAVDGGIDEGVGGAGGAYDPLQPAPLVGERLVALSEPPAALSLLAGRALWIETDRARVKVLALGSGSPGAARTLFESSASDDFGGSLAVSRAGIYWVVESESTELERVFFAPEAELMQDDAAREIAAREAPDRLVAHEDMAYWSERGSIVAWRAPEGPPRTIVTRSQRIVALAAERDRLAWLELPYEAGARGRHRLLSVRPDGTGLESLTQSNESAEAGDLVALDDALWWLEEREDEAALLRFALGAKEPGPLTSIDAGDISAMARDRDKVVYAEDSATRDGGIQTLLWRVAATGRPELIGRAPGPVAAIAADGRHLLIATADGIYLVREE
jgi:hypothetical protein